jgi:hypothetical protein
VGGVASGVNKVLLYITNSTGEYWDGIKFVANVTSVTASFNAGTGTWSYNFTGLGSPAGLYTVESVAVDNAQNAQTTLTTATFHIVGLPTTTKISSSSGPQTGGTRVTLTGTDFSSITSLKIGGVSVKFTINSPTSISFTMPAHLPGNVLITVTNIAGTSRPIVFTYVPVVHRGQH